MSLAAGPSTIDAVSCTARRACLVACLAAPLACGESFSAGEGAAATSSTTGGGGAAASGPTTSAATTTSGAGAAGAAGGGAQGGVGTVPVAELSDRGLVARYWIDEAASGTAPTELEDDASSPLSLPLTYTDDMAFGVPGGHRALSWSAVEQYGRASIALDGTKIQNALEGNAQATIEMVVEIAGASSVGSRLMHVGTSNESRFSLEARAALLEFYWNDSALLGNWNVDFASEGRMVLHLVLDSARASAPERVALYLDGQRLTRVGGTPPALDDVAKLLAGRHFVIGNRESGARTLAGNIFYAALYDVPFEPLELQSAAAALELSDDK